MDFPDFSLEKKFWSIDKLVAGIDEAGRGPIAGPVVAASVIFPINTPIIEGLNDSKKISEKKRTLIYDKVIENSLAYSYSFIDNFKIDEINILQATMLAMTTSVEKLSVNPNHLLVDGNYFKPYFITYDTIVKGDAISASIAAASVIAKVTRDKWMIEVAHKEYPEYDFINNKGYGTKKHYQAIEKHGICKYHRRSFLKKSGY